MYNSLPNPNVQSPLSVGWPGELLRGGVRVTLLLLVLLAAWPAQGRPAARGTSIHRPRQAAARQVAPASTCEAVKTLPAEKVADPLIKEAALAEADRDGDVDCLVHLVLIHAADRNCAGAVKVAQSALARARSEPMVHLAMTVARQCTISMGVAGRLDGKPAQCPELRGAEFASLVRGALLNDHPEAHRFAAAATVQLARFCIDGSGVLLSLAQVLGPKAAPALSCALTSHAQAVRRGAEAAMPLGLTGYQILCDGRTALDSGQVREPAVLHARLALLLDEALKRDADCLKSLTSDCVQLARGLIYTAGELAVRPEAGGLLLSDLGKLGRHGGLQHHVLQEAAAKAFDKGPFHAFRARRSSAELELLDKLDEYLLPDRDSLAAGLLRLELKIVRVAGSSSDDCEKAGSLSKAVADFAPASRTAPIKVWGELVHTAAQQCLADAARCAHASQPRQYCNEVAAGGYPSPSQIVFETRDAK